jgi:hypothetical protein
MSYTCGYNCEDKPGIPAWGLSWGFLSPSKVMELKFHTLTNMSDSAVCKIVKVNRKSASRLLPRSQIIPQNRPVNCLNIRSTNSVTYT